MEMMDYQVRQVVQEPLVWMALTGHQDSEVPMVNKEQGGKLVNLVNLEEMVMMDNQDYLDYEVTMVMPGEMV